MDLGLVALKGLEHRRGLHAKVTILQIDEVGRWRVLRGNGGPIGFVIRGNTRSGVAKRNQCKVFL